MKIRAGYVSNSSSSSFLIGWRDDSIEKFNKFDGYSILKYDISECENSRERAISEGSSIIHSDIYKIYNSYFDNLQKKDGIHDFFDTILNLKWRRFCSFFNYCDEEYEKCIKEAAELAISAVSEFRKYREKNDEEKSCYDFSEDSYSKLDNILEKSGEISEKFFSSVPDDKWIFRAVEYFDDTEKGCYMENKFMNFLSNYPENDMVVITSNHH